MQDMFPTNAPQIRMESPLSDDLDQIFASHVAAMHADTPPESIHMMPRTDLVSDRIAFFVLRVDGQPAGMAALKLLDAGHAELKSMHVLASYRGQGLSGALLRHLLDHAAAHHIGRLSLETGIQPTFIAARGLYRKAGFVECPPFGDYRPDPNSVFMTIELPAP
ncbi:GNAT family N-acetyltransferase [Paracoccus homiensis]|uniref:Putative acetyltransferase n=1 Tax=Paracoccus homiensis TaxID=364199 RepID=A0A1I0H9P8_9RHOB|nr:GNAT family N-acetyltransferase [Paracoccus homiensis]SET79566.1 putative acetyltransferase [Paracoccus homiensis]